MLTVFTTLMFAGAFGTTLYAILTTLLPALPRIAAVLRGAELDAPVLITEPRRSRVTARVSRSTMPVMRAAA